jgi:hypothetical protein
LQVEPLPQWIQALQDLKTTFDPDGNGPGGHGAYVFDGFLPNLSLGGTVFTVPASVPLIGGQALRARVGFEVKIVAPLPVLSTPTLEAGLQANLSLGNSISIPVLALPPTVNFDDDKGTLTITPGATLDPVTLNDANGFSLTLAYDTKIATPLQATLFDAFTVVLPFGIPVELEATVTASLDVMLHAHAQIAYDSVNGLEFLPGGSYLGLGLEGSLSATGQMGWFPPAWVQQLLNYRYARSFKVISLALKDTATVSLNVDAKAHFGGPVSAWDVTGIRFTGGGKFSDKLDLIFQFGNTTVFDLVIADLTKEKPFFSWSLP